MYIYICICICICICTYKTTCLVVWVFVSVVTCMYYIYIYIYTYIHIQIHTYINKYIHYTQVLSKSLIFSFPIIFTEKIPFFSFSSCIFPFFFNTHVFSHICLCIVFVFCFEMSFYISYFLIPVSYSCLSLDSIRLLF